MLSRAETDVLAWAANGASVGGTAARRSVSVETVKRQRRNIFVKLGARNVAHAVAIALRDGTLTAADVDRVGGQV